MKTGFFYFLPPQQTNASAYRKSDSKAVPLAITAVFTSYIDTLSETDPGKQMSYLSFDSWVIIWLYLSCHIAGLGEASAG